ncbi:nuclear transport factor 2 family protein [Parafrankia discariae]|uniref:nuclear transport factor 2 family protein n=1 Tax=Parafrankia discariae TaxID=365528 RepID=UPI0003651748|nr:nuclear transport factor 2 family protein [Parafrankia discariae]
MSAEEAEEKDPVAIVEELARRFLAADAAGAFALFDPEIRMQQPASLPHGGWYEGHAGARRMGVEFGRYWTRVISPPRISGCGDLVVQLTTQTWTATSTGRSATVDVVELITVTAGLVREIRVFQQDTHLLLGTLDRPGASGAR